MGLRTTLLGFALLLVSFLQSSIPIEILALHLLVILAIGEILRRHVPSGIQQTMLANCERSDGSWSDRRAAIERAALRQYVKDILVPVSLIAVGSNVALLVVHHEVLPLPIGLKLLAADPTTDNSELVRDTDRHLPRWLGKDRQQRERRLAKLAPLLWVPAVVGVVGALWLFKTAYVRAVRQLASSVRMRAEQYELQTLARCQNG